jgi:hypothetical protein
MHHGRRRPILRSNLTRPSLSSVVVVKQVVHVYRLMTKGTIEERIMEKAEKKLYLG